MFPGYVTSVDTVWVTVVSRTRLSHLPLPATLQPNLQMEHAQRSQTRTEIWQILI